MIYFMHPRHLLYLWHLMARGNEKEHTHFNFVNQFLQE